MSFVWIYRTKLIFDKVIFLTFLHKKQVGEKIEKICQFSTINKPIFVINNILARKLLNMDEHGFFPLFIYSIRQIAIQINRNKYNVNDFLKNLKYYRQRKQSGCSSKIDESAKQQTKDFAINNKNKSGCRKLGASGKRFCVHIM